MLGKEEMIYFYRGCRCREGGIGTMHIHKRKGILANWREVSKGKIRSKNIEKSDLPISGRPRPGLASLMHIEMSVLELVSQLIEAW